MSSEAAGMERAALAMLRTLGAGKASLLLTQPATVNGQCGLGLVLLQATVTGKQLLALATRGTVQKAINGADGNEATQILCTSMLRAGGTQYRIVSVTVKRFGGAELLYELEIEE